MSIKTLLLVGVLSIAAASGVQAGGKPIGSDFHANAVPAGDTGQSVASGTARSGQIPRLWHPVLAEDTGPGGAGDHNGRSAALSQGGGEFRVASIRGGATGDF
jgi:hypothetical protein